MKSRTALAAAALATVVPLVLTATPATGVEAPQRKPATYKVSAKINKTDVVSGEDTVKITGRVTPKAAGQKVVLQQRREGRQRWQKSGTATVKKSGRFVLKDEPGTRGVRYYRVVKSASKGYRLGTSKELQLNVWGWEPLGYRVMGANEGVVVGNPTIAADWMSMSLSTKTAGTSGFVEYTLGDECRLLRATYALTDASATGATGSVSVSLDGVVKTTHALAVGTVIRDEELDLTDVFRIRFDLASNPGPDAFAAIGTPQVLCLD